MQSILDKIVPKYGNPIINLEGSGEPTMAKDLDLYVKAVKSRNLKCYMYCNGARLNGDFLKKVLVMYRNKSLLLKLKKNAKNAIIHSLNNSIVSKNMVRIYEKK